MTHSTYWHAQRSDSGTVFTDGKGNRAIYNDRSDATQTVYGYLIWADGTRGNYGPLPANLYPVTE